MCGDVRGTVVEVHAVTVKLTDDRGSTAHVAHNRFYKYRGKSADWMARQLGA